MLDAVEAANRISRIVRVAGESNAGDICGRHQALDQELDRTPAVGLADRRHFARHLLPAQHRGLGVPHDFDGPTRLRRLPPARARHRLEAARRRRLCLIGRIADTPVGMLAIALRGILREDESRVMRAAATGFESRAGDADHLDIVLEAIDAGISRDLDVVLEHFAALLRGRKIDQRLR